MQAHITLEGNFYEGRFRAALNGSQLLLRHFP